jgi:hypothetical protein
MVFNDTKKFVEDVVKAVECGVDALCVGVIFGRREGMCCAPRER